MLVTKPQQQIECMFPQVSHSNKVANVGAYATSMRLTDTPRPAGISITMVAQRTTKRTTTNYRDPRHSVGRGDVFVSLTWKIMTKHVAISAKVDIRFSIKVSKMRLHRSHSNSQTDAQRTLGKQTPRCSSLSVQIRQREPSAKCFTKDLSIDEFAGFDTACLTYVATITKRSQSKGTSPPFLEFGAIL
jgi:hypothetical protein